MRVDGICLGAIRVHATRRKCCTLQSPYAITAACHNRRMPQLLQIACDSVSSLTLRAELLEGFTLVAKRDFIMWVCRVSS